MKKKECGPKRAAKPEVSSPRQFRIVIPMALSELSYNGAGKQGEWVIDCDDYEVESVAVEKPLDYGAYLYTKRYELDNLEVILQVHSVAIVVTIREPEQPKTLYSQAFRALKGVEAESIIEECFEEGGDAEDLVFKLRALEEKKDGE